jgi:hypothetical protein
VFDNSTQRSLCVVIPIDSADGVTQVIQPGLQLGLPSRINGTYRVEVTEGVPILAFSISSRTCQCESDCSERGSDGELLTCDLLVLQSGLLSVGGFTSGEFLIQYLPQGMLDQPINITFRFSKCSIRAC